MQIPLGENINIKENKTVSDGTYIGFIVLMFFGAILALTLCNANDIIRKDGSRVILMKNPTWQSELWGLWETLRFEPFVILLFPMFFSSNWFYVYQQNSVNGAYFNTRTKALNGLLYWLAQILAAALWGWLLDIEKFRRTTRAKAAWVALFVLTFAIWGGGYAFEKTYTRETVSPDSGFVPGDWTDSGYAGPMFLYIFYGFYDAAWQATVYWSVSSVVAFNFALLTSPGLWAPCPTLVDDLPTMSVSTRAFSPSVPQSSTTLMHARSPTDLSSSATGLFSPFLLSLLLLSSSSRFATT
jgi:hypothetical protein